MNADVRLEVLRLVARVESERPTRDLMSLAESLVAWIETRQLPEQSIDGYREDRRHA